MARIGVLGGTFDPIHYGHLAIAEEARYILNLARVYLIPAAHQPLKQGQHVASAAHRLAMVQLACDDNPVLIASSIELDRPPPSYTIDTITALRQQLEPDTELYFVLGADALALLPRWRRISELLTLTRFVVLTRPGITLDLDGVLQALPAAAERISVIEGPALEISSEMLRQRMATGLPVRYQLPDPVLTYIYEHKLYGTSVAD
jgi:nicotinate-nucleotide adenylyltransferase